MKQNRPSHRLRPVPGIVGEKYDRPDDPTSEGSAKSGPDAIRPGDRSTDLRRRVSINLPAAPDGSHAVDFHSLTRTPDHRQRDRENHIQSTKASIVRSLMLGDRHIGMTSLGSGRSRRQCAPIRQEVLRMTKPPARKVSVVRTVRERTVPSQPKCEAPTGTILQNIGSRGPGQSRMPMGAVAIRPQRVSDQIPWRRAAEDRRTIPASMHEISSKTSPWQWRR